MRASVGKLSQERGKEATFYDTKKKSTVKVFKEIINIVELLADQHFSALANECLC